MLDAPGGYEVALTKDVSLWRRRVAELNNEIAVRDKERADLMKKLAAAETLLGHDASGFDEETSEFATLRKAIRELLSDGVIRKPKDIRKDLVARGVDPERVSSNTGNFYNALGRLVHDKTLRKDGSSRYWDPAKSPGPATPGDIFK
jgi:hypothetical protein